MYGRGGAGNIQKFAEAQKRAAEDVEAGNASTPSTDTQASSAAARQLSAYAHSGRGGAGNFFSPQELSRTGNFTSTTQPASAASSRLSDLELPSARLGRGGAGNFVWSNAAEAEQNAKEDAAKKEELSKKVAEDVEMGLPKPPTAVLNKSRHESGQWGVGRA